MCRKANHHRQNLEKKYQLPTESSINNRLTEEREKGNQEYQLSYSLFRYC